MVCYKKYVFLNSITMIFFLGIGTCITLNQINYVAEDLFYSDINTIHIIKCLGEAIGQFVLPFALVAIFDNYGSEMGHMIISAIILQILPAMLFVKTDQLPKPIPLSQFGNYNRSYNVFTENETSFGGSQDLNEKTWKNPSSENLAIGNTNDENEINTHEVIVNSNGIGTLEERLGLQILPKIIEVSERSFSLSSEENLNKNDKETIDDTIKRYSKISDKFDELITKEEIDESNIDKTKNKKSDNSQNSLESRRLGNFSEETHSPELNIKITKNFFSKSKSNSLLYKWHNSKRWIHNNLDYFHDTLIAPLLLSLRIWKFYPTLLLNLSKYFIPLGVSILLPTIEINVIDYFILQNTVLISIHATAWLCVLISSPWVINISKSKYKYFTIFGFFTSAMGLFSKIFFY